MLLQLSSGQGPAECELAVGKLLNSLKKEFPDLEVISANPSNVKGGYTSVLLKSDMNLSFLEGSIQWICQSPLRPHHKRKNWFVDVSIIPDINTITTDGQIRMERFHCGGKGGQNVNKVETGVRLIHLPTGTTVTATTERTQQSNRRIALEKLNSILSEKQLNQERRQANDAWHKHNNIVRGNPVRVYRGVGFEKDL